MHRTLDPNVVQDLMEVKVKRLIKQFIAPLLELCIGLIKIYLYSEIIQNP